MLFAMALFNFYSKYLTKEALEGFWRLQNKRANGTPIGTA
jgi:hypothetical protein